MRTGGDADDRQLVQQGVRGHPDRPEPAVRQCASEHGPRADVLAVRHRGIEARSRRWSGAVRTAGRGVQSAQSHELPSRQTATAAQMRSARSHRPTIRVSCSSASSCSGRVFAARCAHSWCRASHLGTACCVLALARCFDSSMTRRKVKSLANVLIAGACLRERVDTFGTGPCLSGRARPDHRVLPRLGTPAGCRTPSNTWSQSVVECGAVIERSSSRNAVCRIPCSCPCRRVAVLKHPKLRNRSCGRG